MPKKKKKQKQKTQKKQKKQKKKKDISIVHDVKEPFSWYRFWDETIVGNWQSFKRYLDKKGILYLLMSPFRYRARLIFRLWLVVICVLVGIVPRTLNLIQEAKSQYRSNELVLVANKQFTSGKFTIVPLLSAHHKNVHVMTFNIVGSSSAGVSSNTNQYDVRITPRSSVTKPEEMYYRYQIIPFDSSQRILVIEMDMSRTDNTGGAFDVWVNEKGTKEMREPMNITISSQQNAGDLYDGDIHLSALSSLMSSSGEQQTIERAEKELVRRLRTYEIEYDRLSQSGMEVSITPKQLSSFTKDHLQFPKVTDKATTDVVKDPPPKVLDPTSPPSLSVTMDGQTIDEATYRASGQSGESSTIDPRYMDDFLSMIENVANVTSAIDQVNQAKLLKYDELYRLSRTLSSPVKDSNFSKEYTVADTKIPTPSDS